MKKILLLAAFAALFGCQPTPEDRVREAMQASTEILVPKTVELRQVRELIDGTICGKLSHESSKGRTEFLDFYVLAGKLELITDEDYQPGKEGKRWFHRDTCLTSPPAQS